LWANTPKLSKFRPTIFGQVYNGIKNPVIAVITRAKQSVMCRSNIDIDSDTTEARRQTQYDNITCFAVTVI